MKHISEKNMKNRNIKHNRRINSAKPMKTPKIGNKSKKRTTPVYERVPKILMPKKPKSKSRGRVRNQKETPTSMERVGSGTKNEFKKIKNQTLQEPDSVQNNEHLDIKQEKLLASDFLGWVKKFIHQNVNSHLANIQKRFSAKNH
jgi:hypothetical protein